MVGGGHNGLVAAAYLARSGLDTVVCERRDVPGGAAVSEHPFGPDYTVTSLSYVVSLLPPDLVRDLRLEQHGYHVYPQGPYFAPRADGRVPAAARRPGGAARRDRPVLPRGRGRLRGLRGAPGAARPAARPAAAPDPAAPRLAAARRPVAGRPGCWPNCGELTCAASVDLTRLLTGEHRRPARPLLRKSDAVRGRAGGLRRHRHLGRTAVGGNGVRHAAPPHRGGRRADGCVGLPARRHGRGQRGDRRRGPVVRRGDPHWRRVARIRTPRRTGHRGDPGHRGGDRRRTSSSRRRIRRSLSCACSTAAELPPGVRGGHPRLAEPQRHREDQPRSRPAAGVHQPPGASDPQVYGGHHRAGREPRRRGDAPSSRRSPGQPSALPFADICIPSVFDDSLAPPGQHVMSLFTQWVPHGYADAAA